MKTFSAICKCGWQVEGFEDRKQAEVFADTHEARARVAHKHDAGVVEGDGVRCLNCHRPFVPEDALQTACSVRCTREFVIRGAGRKPVRVIDTNFIVAQRGLGAVEVR